MGEPRASAIAPRITWWAWNQHNKEMREQLENIYPQSPKVLKVHVDEVTLTCMTTIKATPLQRFRKGDAHPSNLAK
jgi:iron-sulfur cluster repair protein YtfE (RIC family)